MSSPRSSQMSHPGASPTSSVELSLAHEQSTGALNQPAPSATRRNRRALRDFYNLTADPDQASNTNAHAQEDGAVELPTKPSESGENTELDQADFDPQVHVTTALNKAGLKHVMRTESKLLSEIRSLDGEKKALVYDNYSKLIRATDTIGHMRGEMDKTGVGLEGVGAKLEVLVREIVQKADRIVSWGPEAALQDRRHQNDQRRDVKWLVDAPARMRALAADSRHQELENEWRDVQARLDAWANVSGTADVRSGCQDTMTKLG